MTDYKVQQPLNQGSVKLSEVSMDTASDLFQSPVHDSALKVTEQLLKVTADLLRRQSFFLRSEGQMKWDGNTLFFDENAIPNNIVLDILQTENSSQPTISIKMNGTTSAPATETEFKSITLADGEMLYLELDPAVVTAAGTLLEIENSIDFPLTAAAGKRLVKTTIAAGIPTATSPVDQTPNPTPASTTYYFPIVARRGSYLQWIPHGISWPTGTSSPLGAVIVEGFQAYPDLFADNFLQFTSNLTSLAGLGGGVLLVTNSFSLTAPVTVPQNVTVLGRGAKIVITVDAGAQIIMSENSMLENLTVKASSDFSGDAIHMLSSKRAKLRNVIVDLSSAVDQVSGPGFNTNAVDVGKFGVALGTSIYTTLIQPDGKILVGGNFTNYGGTSGRSYLVRFNSDGTLDTTFCNNAVDGGKFTGAVFALALDSSNNIYVGGSFYGYNGVAYRNCLIKLDSLGNLALDNFIQNAVEYKFASGVAAVRSIVVDSFDNVYIGGTFSNYEIAGRDNLIKVTSNGLITPDNFTQNAVDGSKISSLVTCLALDSSNNIYVGGSFINYGFTPARDFLVKLTSAGAITPDNFTQNAVDGGKFGLSGTLVKSLAIDSSDNIYVGGDFINYDTIMDRNYLVKLTPTGAITPDNFTQNAVDGAKFSSMAYSLAVDSSDNVYVGGDFFDYGLVLQRNGLVKLTPTGAITSDNFTQNASDGAKFLNYNITSIAIDSTGNAYVGGNFTSYPGGTGRNYFVKLLPTGIAEGTLPAINVTGVRVEANNCRMYECWFKGVASAVQRVGINYVAGYTDNADVDSLFE